MSAASPISPLPTPQLTLVTPEHVEVHFLIGDLGSRATALIVDLGLQTLTLILAVWLLISLGVAGGGDLMVAFLFLAAFVIRNFYFAFFEARWQGRTPGKRLLRLRVVARDGGPLSSDLILARNLTREIETFLPLSALLAPRSLLPEAPTWVHLATLAWILALTLLPLANRYRARLGDLLAGTVVVIEPQAHLLDDLVEVTRRTTGGGSGGADPVFTTEELDVYGIHELQVLEDLLRRPASPEHERLLALVSRKIHLKLGREEPPDLVPERFLRAFYTAQRARLEGRLLLGDRRERKRT